MLKLYPSHTFIYFCPALTAPQHDQIFVDVVAGHAIDIYSPQYNTEHVESPVLKWVAQVETTKLDGPCMCTADGWYPSKMANLLLMIPIPYCLMILSCLFAGLRVFLMQHMKVFLCGDRYLCFGLHHCFTLTLTDLCTSSLSSIACIHRPSVVLCRTHVYTAHQQPQIDLCVRPKCLASM